MQVVIDAVGIKGYGGEAVLRELLHWLPIVRPEWKWHVFLLSRSLREFDDPPVSEQITFEYTRLGNGGFGRLLWVNQHLSARLRASRTDILFSFANIAPAGPIVPQVIFCHQPNAFLTDSNASFSFLRRARLRFMRIWILRGARLSRAMIVQTEAMRKRILELEPSLQGRIHVIPSGYRTPSANPNIRSEKKALMDGAGKPRLIYVTHPSWHKNHLALLQAMPAILQVLPSASLLLTLVKHGDYRQAYSPLVEEIRRESERLSISKNLVWLGMLNPDEVEYALRSSDLTVYPSLAESFGLGLAESMAAGCPVVAADLPYAHDVCGDAAVYFSPTDPDEIAKAVVAVCCDKDTLKSLRATGSERKNQFSYRKIAEGIAHVFELVTSLTV